jgi:hypothetical protein
LGFKVSARNVQRANKCTLFVFVWLANVEHDDPTRGNARGRIVGVDLGDLCFCLCKQVAETGHVGGTSG